MNEDIYIRLSFYIQPILIVLGTIGALLNQILFRRRKSVRLASCSSYFRALSSNDLLVLYLIVLTQWFNDQFHWNPSSKYLWYCKIRTFMAYCLYAISPYLLVLACFDRLCRTSRNVYLRETTTVTVARRIIRIVILVICLIYSHILFQFHIVHSLCIPLNIFYHQFLAYFLLIIYCLLPPILMSAFCSYTLILLHRRRLQRQNRYKLTANTVQKYRRYQDYQLIKLLCLYVITNIICTLPFAIVFLVYVYKHQSDPQLLALLKCTVLLADLNYCSSFYVYTLSTPLYRQDLLHLIRSLRRRLTSFCR